MNQFRAYSRQLLLALPFCALLAACGGSTTNTTGSGSSNTTASTNSTSGNTTNAASSSSFPANVDLSAELGAPVKIKAPADFKSVATKGIVDEVVVEGSNFYVQIIAQDALGTTDRKALKAEALTEVKALKEFSAIVEENDFGFVFESNWEAGVKGYNFRYFVVHGNRVFDFRTNTVANYPKEQVQAMFAAIQQ
jgi:hypothetical protein